MGVDFVRVDLVGLTHWDEVQLNTLNSVASFKGI